jgi:hypothetical protein
MRFGNIVRRSGKLSQRPGSVRKLAALSASSCYGLAAQPRLSGGRRRPEHPLAQKTRPMAAAAPYRVGAIPAPSIPVPTLGLFVYQLTVIGPSYLQSTLTKKRPITPLQSTLTKTLDLKSPGINTYKKTGGEGVGKADPSAVSPARGACAVIKTNAAPPRGEVPACRPRQEALQSDRRASAVRRYPVHQTLEISPGTAPRDLHSTGAATVHLRELGHAHGK